MYKRQLFDVTSRRASLPLLSSHKWVWLTVMFPACWAHVLDKIRPITIPPQWEIFYRNRRILIAKPLRGPVRIWCQQPPLFLYLMGKQPPWLGDYGRIWMRSLDFSVRDSNTEKSNRHAPQYTSPSNMFPQKIQIPGLYHARSSTDMFPLTCKLGRLWQILGAYIHL